MRTLFLSIASLALAACATTNQDETWFLVGQTNDNAMVLDYDLSHSDCSMIAEIVADEHEVTWCERTEYLNRYFNDTDTVK